MGQLTFHHVYKQYKGEPLPSVKDFHLKVEDGEFLVLVGPSGCGKSTTLRMLAGLEEVTEGGIYINDKFINYQSPKNRDIAMVFQNYALYPNMTVYQNMALGLQLRKTAKYDIELRVNRAAKILEIAHLLDKRPNQLSGGQKQRVALGRAIVREPQVFLMDEPLSNLDAKLRAHTRAEIVKLHQDLQTTTVYVTHDQVEAMTMGTRIVVMKDGVIQQVAPPRQLYEDPGNLFVAGFIGTPQMNFIHGEIREEDGVFLFVTKRCKLPIEEEHVRYIRDFLGNLRQMVMGIRPEQLMLTMPGKESSDAGVVEGTVEMVELMGPDQYIHVNIGISVVARIDPSLNVQPGEKVGIRFRMEKAHFFHGETGMSIRRTGSTTSWLQEA